MTKSLVLILGVVAFSAGMATASASIADTIVLKSELHGASEVPPNDSPAAGMVEATFDTETKLLTYTATFSGLTGPAIGAHFHGPAEPGENAGIALPFLFVMSPVKGKATLSDAQAQDMLAGKWYANVHTEAHPGGEIRGQLTR